MPISPRTDILSENESVLRGVRISKSMSGNVAGGCTRGGGGWGGGLWAERGSNASILGPLCPQKPLLHAHRYPGEHMSLRSLQIFPFFYGFSLLSSHLRIAAMFWWMCLSAPFFLLSFRIFVQYKAPKGEV